jgi:hypothetical protein
LSDQFIETRFAPCYQGLGVLNFTRSDLHIDG